MAEPKSPGSRTAKGSMSGKPGDPRVKRTRDALGDALVELMQQKPFDGIRVQDVLDLAGVSRSTFYEHFKDKDDLFESDAEEFFEMMANALSKRNDASERVVPVRELFEHLREMQKLFEAIVASGKVHDNLALAQGHFARGIERRLKEIPRGRSVPEQQRAVFAQAQAGALISLLQWWVRRGMKEPPAEMDDLFHRMFWNGAGL
jgi:AcrR family transcriptional regulator